jgi:hypothetical protein
MRKNDHLGADLSAPINLMDSVIPPKTVHAGKWVSEDDNFGGPVCILLQLRQEKGKR